MDGKEFYRTVLGIQDHKLVNELGKQSEVRTIKKGTIIQNAGEDCKFTSFLISGLFRSFFLDGNGNEVTDSFSYLPGTPLVASMGVKAVRHIFTVSTLSKMASLSSCISLL